MSLVRPALLSLALALAGCGTTPLLPDGGELPADAGFTDGGLDLNDVSWLFPLPSPTQLGLLPGLASAGAKGALLSRAHFDQVPGPLTALDGGARYEDFRVVSARVDPCFPASASGGCIRQVRLVVQPVVVEALQVTTHDVTLHLFYELSDADFALARTAVLELRGLAGTRTTFQPLDVHPVMKAEGLAGAYATRLREMLASLCGEQNLTRVAFMRLVQQDVAWNFGALNLRDGTLEADTIPRLNALTLQGVQEFGNTDFRSGQLQPEPTGDALSTLLSESEFRLTDQRTWDRALTAALQLEHPARLSPKTADCGSCHVASRSLRNALTERSADLANHPDRYVGNPRFDLRRVDGAGDDPRALRAFGYFGRLSALSQRTINESAEVAEAMSR